MAHFYWLGNDMGYCRERGSLENCNDFHLCEIDFFFLNAITYRLMFR